MNKRIVMCLFISTIFGSRRMVSPQVAWAPHTLEVDADALSQALEVVFTVVLEDY